MNTRLKEYVVIATKSWVFTLALSILVATSFKSSFADWNDVPTGSMLPTILIGDRVFVNKLAYDLKIPFTTFHLAEWSAPKRGDIVVFFSPKDGTRLIKRVVGTPGDVIGMRNNRLFINGSFLDYSPLDNSTTDQIVLDSPLSHLFFSEDLTGKQHSVMLSPSRPSLMTFGPMTVPQGKYFMLGDNRDNSADSRFFGFVDRSVIIGKATSIVLSRDDSFLKPRWSRFFEDLI